MRRLSVKPRRAGAALRLLVLAGLSVIALTLTSSGFAVVNLDSHSTGLRDFDSRGKVAPTTAQLRAARSNPRSCFVGPAGTPASVIHYGGYLAAGIKAPYAESAALNWVAAHKTAFGLRSVKNLGCRPRRRFGEARPTPCPSARPSAMRSRPTAL